MFFTMFIDHGIIQNYCVKCNNLFCLEGKENVCKLTLNRLSIGIEILHNLKLKLIATLYA